MKLITRKVDQIDQMATGTMVRAARHKAGKSLRFIAGKLGFSVAYLSDLERGRRGWSESLLERFERAL